jgi:hypothetical protein
MRTTPVIALALAFGVAFALMSGSGIGQAVFGENPGEAESTSTLEDIGDDADVGCEGSRDSSGQCENEKSGVSADVAGDNEPTLVGFAISGGEFIVQTVGAVALLPFTLMRLGFPNYFAVPVGALAQIIGTIGLFQFVRTGELI